MHRSTQKHSSTTKKSTTMWLISAATGLDLYNKADTLLQEDRYHIKSNITIQETKSRKVHHTYHIGWKSSWINFYPMQWKLPWITFKHNTILHLMTTNTNKKTKTTNATKPTQRICGRSRVQTPKNTKESTSKHALRICGWCGWLTQSTNIEKHKILQPAKKTYQKTNGKTKNVLQQKHNRKPSAARIHRKTDATRQAPQLAHLAFIVPIRPTRRDPDV